MNVKRSKIKKEKWLISHAHTCTAGQRVARGMIYLSYHHYHKGDATATAVSTPLSSRSFVRLIQWCFYFISFKCYFVSTKEIFISSKWNYQDHVVPSSLARFVCTLAAHTHTHTHFWPTPPFGGCQQDLRAVLFNATTRCWIHVGNIFLAWFFMHAECQHMFAVLHNFGWLVTVVSICPYCGFISTYVCGNMSLFYHTIKYWLYKNIIQSVYWNASALNQRLLCVVNIHYFFIYPCDFLH